MDEMVVHEARSALGSNAVRYRLIKSSGLKGDTAGNNNPAAEVSILLKTI